MPETLAFDEFRLLRTIAFAGAVSEPGEILGLEGCDVPALLSSLSGAGRVEHDDVITLTNDGDAMLVAQYDAEHHRLSPEVRERMHEEFRPLDREVKRLAAAWQHSDTRNDWDGRLEVLEGLERLEQQLGDYLGGPASELSRLREYHKRVGRALARAQDGELEFVVGVSVDSYHTAWFHMHEDLLRILKKERDPE